MDTARLGGQLFARRAWMLVPLGLLAVLLPGPGAAPAAGLAVILLGEAVRLWAVGTIGLPSRTRGADVGPLRTTGAYAVVRNPLYVGNILLWIGVALHQGLPWAALVPVVLVTYYDLIVRWEEERLAAVHGAVYRAYRERVSRWWPRWGRGSAEEGGGSWSVRTALRAERGTLLVLAAVLAALWLRRTMP